MLGAVKGAASKGVFHLEPLGLIVLVAGITCVILKRSEGGRTWLEKNFGKTITKEGVIGKFFGWPMVLTGILLALPDRYWAEIWNFGFCFLAYVAYYLFFWNKNRKSKKDSVNAQKASDVSV